MKIYYQHPWNISAKEAYQIQTQLRNRVNLTVQKPISSIKTIAAADISYSKGSKTLYAALVLVSFPGMAIKAVYYSSAEVTFPYIPGYLSFREIPVLIKIFEKIPEDFDVLLCDGQGIAHPRRFGLACHLGTLLDKAALGCAKSRLMGTHEEPPEHKGGYSILYDGEEAVGAVLRTRSGVKPVFVSPGNQLDISAAREIVMNCVSRYRIPDPLRYAHHYVNEFRRENEN